MEGKYVIVKGCAGLGNRLLTVFAAIEYAHRTNRILVVDWMDGLYGYPGVNAFSNYFELEQVNYKEVVKQEDLNAISYQTVFPIPFKNKLNYNLYDLYVQIAHPFFRRIPGNSFSFCYLNRLKGFWTLKSESPSKRSLLSYLKLMISKNTLPLGDNLSHDYKEDILIFADYVPSFYKQHLKSLKLKTKVQNVIDSFCKEFPLHSAVGIHIRNTDMKPTRTVESLVEQIKMEHPDKPVFLSTDDAKLVEMFKGNFNNVIVYEKYHPPVTAKQGMHQWAQLNNDYEKADVILKDSIIDMYLLSRCELLYYQGNSSFSVLANGLHANPGKSFNWLTN